MKNSYSISLAIILAVSTLVFPGCRKDSINPPEESELPLAKKYLLDIALGSEFGGNSATLKKWGSNLKIYLKDTTHHDLVEEFNQITAEINELSEGIKMERVDQETEANFVIFFSDQDTYAAFEPNARDHVAGNYGLVWIYWDSQCTITRGSMYVDVFRTVDINCQKHLLREELTQGLGLLNDSYTYPQSIFYQDWTCTTGYAEVDRELLQYFLDESVLPCMHREALTEVLQDL